MKKKNIYTMICILFFAMLSHGKIVIPNFLANYMHMLKIENFLFKEGKIFLNDTFTLVENLEYKTFWVGYHFNTIIFNFVLWNYYIL